MEYSVRDIAGYIEDKAPLSYQEPYDNAGLICGDSEMPVSGILTCLDITEQVIDEAISHGLNMIVAHHPIIFKPLKKVTGKTLAERCLIKSIKGDIALYAAHTNYDAIEDGVNSTFKEKFRLNQVSVLRTSDRSGLLKLAVYCPSEALENVTESLFRAGAGRLGNYTECSFAVKGEGTFTPSDGATPYTGELGNRSQEQEFKVEFIVEERLMGKAEQALRAAHPYEEPAFDWIQLKNPNTTIGSGIIGKLPQEICPQDFFQQLKEVFSLQTLKFSTPSAKSFSRVSFCGGSGGFLIKDAISQGADVFITSEIKYHDYVDYGEDICLIDIGHYESEYLTKELFVKLLSEKIPNFVIRSSESSKNPVNYL